jgi:hypothetical protein
VWPPCCSRFGNNFVKVRSAPAATAKKFSPLTNIHARNVCARGVRRFVKAVERFRSRVYWGVIFWQQFVFKQHIWFSTNGLKSAVWCHWTSVCSAVLFNIRRAKFWNLDQLLQCKYKLFIFGWKMHLTFLCIDQGWNFTHDIRRNSDPRCSQHYGEIQCKIGLQLTIGFVKLNLSHALELNFPEDSAHHH